MAFINSKMQKKNVVYIRNDQEDRLTVKAIPPFDKRYCIRCVNVFRQTYNSRWHFDTS